MSEILSDIDMATLREGVAVGLEGLDDEMSDSMEFTQDAITDAWAFVRKTMDFSELDSDALMVVKQSWVVGAESAEHIDDGTFDRISGAISWGSPGIYP